MTNKPQLWPKHLAVLSLIQKQMSWRFAYWQRAWYHTCLFCTVCVGRHRYKPWQMRRRDNNGKEDEREMSENGKFDRQRGERGRAQRGGGREGKCKQWINIHVHRQKGCSVQNFQPFAMWVGDTNAEERGGGMRAFTSLKNDSTDQEVLRKMYLQIETARYCLFRCVANERLLNNDSF